jgi:hypothetical protein
MIVGPVCARLVVTIGGYLYPGYKTFKSLRGATEEQHFWLMFWVVMAVFTTVEWPLDFFASWLPFYYDAKVAFIIWLQLEHFQGATFLHHHYVEPFLLKHQQTIDTQARELFKSVKDARWEEWSEMLRSTLAGLMGAEVRAMPADSRARCRPSHRAHLWSRRWRRSRRRRPARRPRARVPTPPRRPARGMASRRTIRRERLTIGSLLGDRDPREPQRFMIM